MACRHAAAGHEGVLTGAQWSRPASRLILGVRPNSPQTMTLTSSVEAALMDVFDEGGDAVIEDGEVRRRWRKLPPCVSQKP